MRVLHFCRGFSPTSQTFIYDYIVELERQGVDCDVVTLQRSNKESRPFSKVTELETPSRWDPRRLWHFGRYLIGSEYCSEEAKRISTWPHIRDSLAEVVRRIQCDVVHAHFGPAGVLLRPVAAAAGIPFIVSFHGFDAFRLPLESFWRDKYTALFEDAESITVVSDVMAEHLTDVGAPPDKISVVRVGKRIEDYPYRAPSSPVRNWISVGRLVEKKGFGDCIRAFQRLVGSKQESSLEIIGDGRMHDSLQRKIESAGLSQNVRLLGSLPHGEVKRRLRAAHGFILCSKEAEDGDREGVPTVLMEAQATGLPVVSTTHSGIPEVIPKKNHNFLASEGKIEEIYNCMIKMESMPIKELRNISRRGRRKIEKNFNLSREVESLIQIYNNC